MTRSSRGGSVPTSPLVAPSLTTDQPQPGIGPPHYLLEAQLRDLLAQCRELRATRRERLLMIESLRSALEIDGARLAALERVSVDLARRIGRKEQ